MNLMKREKTYLGASSLRYLAVARAGDIITRSEVYVGLDVHLDPAQHTGPSLKKKCLGTYGPRFGSCY